MSDSVLNYSNKAAEEINRFKLLLRAFKHRNYKLFFGGQIVSLVGNFLTATAMSWLVLRLTNDPWLLGVVAGYGAAFLIYMTLIKRAPIGPAFAASHLEIDSVTLFSVAFLGDRLSALQALGCCAIVSGVIVLAATESGS